MADEPKHAHSVRVRQCDCGVTAHLDLCDANGEIFATCSIEREAIPEFLVAIGEAAGIAIEATPQSPH